MNILITGSSAGIGKKTAEILTNAGHRVFQTGTRKLNCENYLSIDLSLLENVSKLYNYVQNNFGEIDVLINNAGEYIYSPVDKTSKQDVSRLFNLNFLSHYILTSLVISYMKQKKFGRIVNISSISAAVGEANASLYAATKSAFYGFTKSLALELCEFGITINSISPGFVDTNLNEKALSSGEKAEILEVIPQKRFIEPVEVANLIKYLISNEAKGITGQNINLCAGLSCGC